MEAILLGGLLLIGNAINKRNIGKTNIKTNNPKDKENNFNDLNHFKINKIPKTEYPIVENVIESLPNSSFIEDNKPTKSSSLDDLFKPLNIQNVGGPTAFNQAPDTIFGEDTNLKRQIEFMEGFSTTDNNENYGITKDFTHNNMIPATSQRDIAMPNYDNYNTRLDLHTGSSRDWQPKKEVENMFQPMKMGGYEEKRVTVNGELASRYIPSFKNNMGNLPFKNNIKVKPGIDGKNQTGKYAVTRILPRSIDELKGENNQQVTYSLPVIESGIKARAPQVQSVLTVKKPQAFKITTIDDLVPVKGIYTKAVPRGKYFISSNARASSMEIKGPAHLRTVGSRTDHNYQASNKVTHTFSDNIGGASNRNKASIQEQYIDYETQRETTSHSITGGASSKEKGTWVKNINDIAKPTLRQTTNYTQEGYTKGEVSSSYANWTDKAKGTIKENTLYSQEGFTSGDVPASYANWTDKAKGTIKENTLYSQEGNLANQNTGSYANWTDDAKGTIKETTLYSQEGNLANQNTGSYANWTDDAKGTIKETTLYSQEGNLANQNTGSYANWTDDAKGTIKETTLYSQEGFIKNDIPAIYTGWTDQAKPTIKQSTLYSQEGHVGAINTSSYSNLTDKARKTIKQTTLYSQEGNIGPVNTASYSSIQDKMKPTIKQTTLLQGYTGIAGDTTVHKHRTYDDILNMEHDESKEDTLESRPNPGGKQQLGARYKRDEADTRKRKFINSAREPNIARPLDYQTPDANLTEQTRNRDASDSYKKNYHVNNNFINTLATNPYVNDIRHPKNINYTL